MKDDLKSLLALCCALATAVPGAAFAQAKPPAKPRADEPVGRLFFTPAQRASLDIARTQRARTTLSTEATTEETAAPAAQTITYGGMVRRSDGKSTIWINNRAVNDNEALGGTVVGKVRPNGSVTLELPQTGRSVDLKPGQSLELLSGTIEEGYSRKPVAPEPKPATKPSTDAKGEKPAASERVIDGQDREEQQRKLEEVVRALQKAAKETPGSRSPATNTAPPGQ